MYTLTYEFKLKPTANQVAIFEDWLEQCRKVYNYALAERKDWYKSRSCRVNACSLRSEYIIPADAVRPTFASQCKALTAYRQTSPNLKRVHSQVLQQTLRRLENAFVGMWEQGRGFPRFKKAGRMRSFLFPQLGKNPLKPGRLKFPSIGWVKFRQSRDIPVTAAMKQARVIKRVDGWFVQLVLQWSVELPEIQPSLAGRQLGLDVGLTSFIAASDGRQLPRPKFFGALECKLRLLQQRVSRKVKGSSHWKKLTHRVARLHRHIANKRQDFYWKLAHQLCDGTSMIFVEDLNLKGLSQGMLAKHCLDAGWGQFFQILEQCCFKRGVYFLKVSAHKTSQTCPNCLTETGKKTLAERTHHCQHCGYTTDRDVAAAQIVLSRGLSAVGYTVKMLAEGKVVGLPAKQESPAL